jgi:hypothetical protein
LFVVLLVVQADGTGEGMLFRIHCGIRENHAHAIEICPRSSGLSSGDAFVVVTKGPQLCDVDEDADDGGGTMMPVRPLCPDTPESSIFVWHGGECSELERNVATKLAEMLARPIHPEAAPKYVSGGDGPSGVAVKGLEVKVFEEASTSRKLNKTTAAANDFPAGSDEEAFWQALGGPDSYSVAPQASSKWQAMRWLEPRLFHCSNTLTGGKKGGLQVKEIARFNQSDLYPDDGKRFRFRICVL